MKRKFLTRAFRARRFDMSREEANPAKFPARFFRSADPTRVRPSRAGSNDNGAPDASRETEIERRSSHGHFVRPTILPRMRGDASLPSIQLAVLNSDLARSQTAVKKKKMPRATVHESAASSRKFPSRKFSYFRGAASVASQTKGKLCNAREPRGIMAINGEPISLDPREKKLLRILGLSFAKTRCLGGENRVTVVNDRNLRTILGRIAEGRLLPRTFEIDEMYPFFRAAVLHRNGERIRTVERETTNRSRAQELAA